MLKTGASGSQLDSPASNLKESIPISSLIYRQKRTYHDEKRTIISNSNEGEKETENDYHSQNISNRVMLVISSLTHIHGIEGKSNFVGVSRVNRQIYTNTYRVAALLLNVFTFR